MAGIASLTDALVTTARGVTETGLSLTVVGRSLAGRVVGYGRFSACRVEIRRAGRPDRWPPKASNPAESEMVHHLRGNRLESVVTAGPVALRPRAFSALLSAISTSNSSSSRETGMLYFSLIGQFTSQEHKKNNSRLNDFGKVLSKPLTRVASGAQGLPFPLWGFFGRVPGFLAVSAHDA